jgi:CheY-like chemotaxis protein
VLIVDDEADAREIVSVSLTQYGADTAVVGSAREALDALSDFKPDVLVSDIRMPGEDGFSLIEQVRGLGDSAESRIPAVALTGLASAADRRRALSAGYQSFVPKPVEADDLATVIRRLARRASAG